MHQWGEEIYLQLRILPASIWSGVVDVMTTVADTSAQRLMVNMHILLPKCLLTQLPKMMPVLPLGELVMVIDCNARRVVWKPREG